MKLPWIGGVLLGLVAGCGNAPVTGTTTGGDGSATTHPAPAPAAPAASATTVEQATEAFYAAFQKADCEGMADFYAPEVTLLPGCEFLKKDYGVPLEGADAKTGVQLTRAKLMEVYKGFFGRVGKDKWTAIFGGLPATGLSYHLPEEYASHFPGALKDDVLVLVPFGHGDDKGAFVFRKNDQGAWKIVMELTDY